MGFGAIVSGIGSAASTAATVGSGALNFIGRIGSTAVNAIGHVAQVGLGVLKVAGGVLAGAVGAFVGAVTLASKATLDFSNNILSIKAATGMGYGAASRTALNFGAYGVGSGELAGLLDNIQMIPQLFRPRAAAFGLPDYQSKDFIPKLATEFQKLGPIVGRSMLQTLGMDTPSVRRLSAMSPEKLQAQQGFSQRIQSSLGVSPGSIQNWAEDFSLLMNRVGQFVDLLKYKFASEMLPFLSATLERVTSYLGENSGKISDLIKSGISWIFNDLPGIINKAVHTAADWAKGVVQVFGAISSTASNFIRTLADTNSAFWKFVEGLAKVADIVVALVPRRGDTGQWTSRPTTVQSSLMSPFGLDKKAFSYAGNAIGRMQEGGSASSWLQGVKANAPNALNGLADAIDKRTKTASDAINNAIDKGVDFWDNNISSLISETNRKMDEQGKDLKGIRKATERTAQGAGSSSYNATIERFEGYISEDAWALANR